jgi:hypothetical protein
MSYSLVPYAIDLEQLRAAVGSRNASLKQEVCAANAERIEEDAEDLEDDESLTLKAAVSELIDGEFSDEDSAHQYGYALEALCSHLGQSLDVNLWCGVRWEAMDVTGLDDVIIDSGPPVDLPDLTGNFPTIGHLDAKAVAAAVGQLDASPSKHDDSDAQALLAEYETWLRTTHQAGKGIVFFYY